MDRRTFLKGLLGTSALAVLPVTFARGGIVKTPPYVIFSEVPLEAFGNRIPNIAFEMGSHIGRQLFPEAPLDENQKGPRLKRNKDGTLWVRLENRGEGLHP